MKNALLVWLIGLFTLCAVGCAFEPEGAPEPTADEITQALQGCGVEVVNHWTEPFGSGVLSVAYMKNLGARPCAFRWQYEVKKGSVSHYSPVLPSATTWLTLQPGQQVNHSYQYPNVTSPCTSRMHVKMGSSWFASTWLACF